MFLWNCLILCFIGAYANNELGCHRWWNSAALEGGVCGRRVLSDREIEGECGLDANYPCPALLMRPNGVAPEADSCGFCATVGNDTTKIHVKVIESVEQAADVLPADVIEVDTYFVGPQAFKYFDARVELTGACVQAISQRRPLSIDFPEMCSILAHCHDFSSDPDDQCPAPGAPLVSCGAEDEDPCAMRMEDNVVANGRCGVCYAVKGADGSELRVMLRGDVFSVDPAVNWDMMLPEDVWARLHGEDSCTDTDSSIITYREVPCTGPIPTEPALPTTTSDPTSTTLEAGVSTTLEDTEEPGVTTSTGAGTTEESDGTSEDAGSASGLFATFTIAITVLYYFV